MSKARPATKEDVEKALQEITEMILQTVREAVGQRFDEYGESVDFKLDKIYSRMVEIHADIKAIRKMLMFFMERYASIEDLEDFLDKTKTDPLIAKAEKEVN